MFFNWFFRVVSGSARWKGEKPFRWIDYPRLVTRFCILCRPQRKLAGAGVGAKFYARKVSRDEKQPLNGRTTPAERKIKNLEKLWRTSTTDGNIFSSRETTSQPGKFTGVGGKGFSFNNFNSTDSLSFSFFFFSLTSYLCYLNKN